MRGKQLAMKEARNIIHRLRQGQPKRAIERETGIHRSIIRKLCRIACDHQWLDSASLMPDDAEIAQKMGTNKSDEIHPLDPYRDQLRLWHKEGLSSVVIQRLLQDKFPCDVQVIRRYRQKHFPQTVVPVMVRTTTPGKELELDFGELGKFYNQNKELKRAWLFSLRLRHSRKAFRTIVTDQTMTTFLMGHVHAFEYFGGVPAFCIMDNLKAAVIRSTIENDQINKAYQELAEHYGFIISPCPPATPEQKGGIEGDVKYVKKNFLSWYLASRREAGTQIPEIQSLKEALKKWESEIADQHLIQGIDRSPDELFYQEELPALKPLPKSRFELISWHQCTVRRDWRIMVESSFYSVPHHLINKKVNVRVSSSFVQIFYNNNEVAHHEKARKKWEYRRKPEHAPPFKEAVLQCTREGLFLLAEEIGPFTKSMTEAILSHPTVDKLKPARLLLRLAEKYSRERLEKACQRALACKMSAYGNVKNILQNDLDSKLTDSSSTDKIIPISTYKFARDPSDYRSQETFDEKFERIHPISHHGNAMFGGFIATLADAVIDENNQ